MTIKTPAFLAIATFLFASSLLPAGFAAAQAGESVSAASDNSGATSEAAKMVPAAAIFLSSVDSQKAKAGTPVKIQLKGKVRLANGTELPSGTVLSGQVVDDTTQVGAAKLALRFTQATLKNGQSVPVKVTIFSIRKQSSDTQSAEANEIGTWDKQALGIDQMDVLPGIGLHSKIASPDSVVFVSTKKELKFSQGYGVGLAIAPLSSSGQHSEYGY